jgi:Lrp/AsnC family leucine-responsive transcriptional regulator
MTKPLDETDWKILRLLQKNARMPNVEIARELGMAPSSILDRIRSLEERGVITGYTVRINPAAVGAGLTAFVFVRAGRYGTAKKVARGLLRKPAVQEIHHVAGEDCFVMKLRARDTAELSALLRECFGDNESVTSTRTTIVLETEKETSDVPLVG